MFKSLNLKTTSGYNFCDIDEVNYFSCKHVDFIPILWYLLHEPLLIKQFDKKPCVLP